MFVLDSQTNTHSFKTLNSTEMISVSINTVNLVTPADKHGCLPPSMWLLLHSFLCDFLLKKRIHTHKAGTLTQCFCNSIFIVKKILNGNDVQDDHKSILVSDKSWR